MFRVEAMVLLDFMFHFRDLKASYKYSITLHVY